MQDTTTEQPPTIEFREFVRVIDGRAVLVFPSDATLVAYLKTPRIPLLPILSDGELLEDDGTVYGSGRV